MSDLMVRGSPKEQASNERIAWGFNWAEPLGAQTITAASATVTRMDTGADVTVTNLYGAVGFTATTTSVTIIALTAGKRYRVVVLATFSGGSQQARALILEAPF